MIRNKKMTSKPENEFFRDSEYPIVDRSQKAFNNLELKESYKNVVELCNTG